MGFEEIQHTADVALRVWSRELPELFVEAARGLNALAGAVPVSGRGVRRTFQAEAPDAESLLVAFLSELIYYAEQENLGFEAFDVHIADNRISVVMEGAPLAALRKAIKAVTFHNLAIRRNEHGYEVEIVFDV